MIKVIAIIFLLYFFFRSIGYVLRIMLGQGNSATPNSNRQTRSYRQKPKGSNLNVETPAQKSKKDQKSFDAGEYIEYEEVD
jgi:hypothetical protein